MSLSVLRIYAYFKKKLPLNSLRRIHGEASPAYFKVLSTTNIWLFVVWIISPNLEPFP